MCVYAVGSSPQGREKLPKGGEGKEEVMDQGRKYNREDEVIAPSLRKESRVRSDEKKNGERVMKPCSSARFFSAESAGIEVG